MSKLDAYRATDVPGARRCFFYKPRLDPTLTKAEEEAAYDDSGEMSESSPQHPANCVSSLCTDGLHHPALDIDMKVELVPSSTPGHFHLYFPDVALTWDEYEALLDALVDAGIVEDAYRNVSVECQQTLLRLPGARKQAS